MENDYIKVGMDEIKITDSNNKIIGTQALATCVGVLLYIEKYKTALVAHISDKPEQYFERILYILKENNLFDTKIKYAVIRGYYYNHYKLYENLCSLFEDFKELFIPLNYNKSDIEKDEDLPALQFIFNAETGNFVKSKKNNKHIH